MIYIKKITLIVIAAVSVLIVGSLLLKSFYASKSRQNNLVSENVPDNTIVIKDFKYSPSVLKIKPKQAITFINQDGMEHSITADDNSFDTGTLSKGESKIFIAPDKTGTYTFHCSTHPSIVGTLIIE